MQYPQDFVEKAKRMYPNWIELHELLDAGSSLVGHMLYQARVYNMPLTTILNATSLEELQDAAKRAKAGHELADDWSNIWEAHKKHIDAQILKSIEELKQLIREGRN
jgi:hypothetical protein